jgi:hypothetical protein
MRDFVQIAVVNGTIVAASRVDDEDGDDTSAQACAAAFCEATAEAAAQATQAPTHQQHQSEARGSTMTTYSKHTPWGRKYRTELYLIYRIKAGRLQCLGVFETRGNAEENLACISQGSIEVEDAWQIHEVECSGWGIIDGMVTRNEPTTSNDADEDWPPIEAWLKTCEEARKDFWRNQKWVREPRR